MTAANEIITYLTALYATDPATAAAVVVVYTMTAAAAVVVAILAIRRRRRRGRRGRVEFYSTAAGSGFTGRRLSTADRSNHGRGYDRRRRRHDGQ